MKHDGTFWYPLKCMGTYLPFAFADDEYLIKDRICSTEEECRRLCNRLNRKERFS